MAKILTITDFNTHSSGESIYPLLSKMAKDEKCTKIDVLSRSNLENSEFFQCKDQEHLFVSRVDENFKYSNSHKFYRTIYQTSSSEYDVIFLRIDRPVTNDFLSFVKRKFKNAKIINQPDGIIRTASKEFLIDFPNLCPPLKLCHSYEQIIEFSKEHAIVLKPLRGYGGNGILKIVEGEYHTANSSHSLAHFEERYKEKIESGYLCMKYLKNVSQGDKRIIVVNNKVIGSVLRKPLDGNWLCNLTQGGTISSVDVTKSEIDIVGTLSDSMTENGIVIYGIDTLVEDNGIRVLSEINTLNVGGLIQAEKLSNKNVVKSASDRIWEYINSSL